LDIILMNEIHYSHSLVHSFIQQDFIKWRWTSTGIFTVKLFYNFFFDGWICDDIKKKNFYRCGFLQRRLNLNANEN
jgi:hypothetical protein